MLCCVVLYDRYEYVDRCCVRVRVRVGVGVGVGVDFSTLVTSLCTSSAAIQTDFSSRAVLDGWVFVVVQVVDVQNRGSVMYTTFDTGEGRNIGKPTLCNAMLCNR